ncbi:hypothetical protein D021_0226A, partial [Vibrio parahaemolyticus 10296]
MSWFRIG